MESLMMFGMVWTHEADQMSVRLVDLVELMTEIASLRRL